MPFLFIFKMLKQLNGWSCKCLEAVYSHQLRYRDLLDAWSLWHERALLDIARGQINPSGKRPPQVSRLLRYFKVYSQRCFWSVTFATNHYHCQCWNPPKLLDPHFGLEHRIRHLRKLKWPAAQIAVSHSLDVVYASCPWNVLHPLPEPAMIAWMPAVPPLSHGSHGAKLVDMVAMPNTC